MRVRAYLQRWRRRSPCEETTKFLTNSAALKQELCKLCPGCKRHEQLVEGRAKEAQHYPKQLCRAVTRGIIEQARMDSRGVYSMVCEDLMDGMFENNHIEHEPETWKTYCLASLRPRLQGWKGMSAHWRIFRIEPS